MKSTSENAIGKSILAGILIATGLFFTIVFLGNSWIKLTLIGLIIISSIIWLVSHGSLRRAIKYLIIVVMIFAISFNAFHGYLLLNAGSPPTIKPSQPDVTISYSSILNVSLTEIVQSVKNTYAFSLISIEYPYKTTFESIVLDTTFKGGRIEVMLYQKSSNLGFTFESSSGHSYHASIISWKGYPYSQTFSHEQSPEENLKQIDTLGLHWFFESAIETYQNKTGLTPKINGLQISTQWDNYRTYEGMTLLLVGSYQENFSGHGVFFAYFQPNGTLLYLNTSK